MSDVRDLGPCPATKCEDMGGEPGRLVALVSNDGSAWLAEACNRCGCSWWFAVPRVPRADVSRVSATELEALRCGTRMAYAPQAGDGAEVV
jgi:hypothetical protein